MSCSGAAGWSCPRPPRNIPAKRRPAGGAFFPPGKVEPLCRALGFWERHYGNCGFRTRRLDFSAEVLYLLDTERQRLPGDSLPQRLRHPFPRLQRVRTPKTKHTPEDDPHGGAFPVPPVLYGWEAVALSGGRPHRKQEKAHAEGNLAVAPIHRWSGWGLRLFSGNFRQVIE